MKFRFKFELFIKENTFEMSSAMSVILFWPQCVKPTMIGLPGVYQYASPDLK